jgi:uncharacterized protein DUF4160
VIQRPTIQSSSPPALRMQLVAQVGPDLGQALLQLGGQSREIGPHLRQPLLELRIQLRDALLQLRIELRQALFELRVEPREVMLVQLAQVATVRGIDGIEPVHQLVHRLMAQFAVELLRELHRNGHDRSPRDEGRPHRNTTLGQAQNPSVAAGIERMRFDGCPVARRGATSEGRSCAQNRRYAVYGEHRVSVEVDSGAVHGTFPPRALRHVLEWAALHRTDLLANWQRAREGKPLDRIAPLE